MRDPNLLVGFDTSDDACVYRLTDALAIVETVDFFPPMVDDPYQFGQVAAANALSDIYAMGATPRFAMNLLCAPNCLSPAVIGEILRGGADKALEAGCVIAGGHTIEDSEPKYGLCVTGIIHPDAIWTNTGARPGDVLVLTKPLGSGILSTALKAGLLDDASYRTLLEQMTLLNARARDALQGLEVHACTDVTGFGLAGHANEMAGADKSVTLALSAASLPLLPQARALAEMGIIPGGAYRNREYLGDHLLVAPQVGRWAADLICDPQTSGGLLAALPERDADILLSRLAETQPWACRIGEVLRYRQAAVELI